METTETVDVHINKVLALTNQMKTNGETQSEQAKVEKILRSLTPRFEHVIAAIKEANDISKMTVSKGRGGHNHGGIEQNNTGFNHNPSSNNSWHGERDRGGQGGIYNKSNIECHNCHKCEHYANECISKGDNHVTNCAQENSNHEQDEEDHAVPMAVTSNETPNNRTWYLDTGCTNHMCDSEPVRLADAIQHPKWQEAMNEELMAMEKNNIMTQIGFNLDVPIKIYVDNVSVINLAKNQVFHQRINVFIKLRDLLGQEGYSKSELRENVGY
ncbi:uncharacterized protein [Phaseolus vulgaris]|uniref:uncharacterized protein n=1 Tax=Phaseolus vulgaris TaxID=3885 RepID=UPI0035CB8196